MSFFTCIPLEAPGPGQLNPRLTLRWVLWYLSDPSKIPFYYSYHQTSNRGSESEALNGVQNMTVGGRFLKSPPASGLPVSAQQTLEEKPIVPAVVYPPSQRSSSRSSHKVAIAVAGAKRIRPAHPVFSAMPEFPGDRLIITASPSPQWRSTQRNQPRETTCQSNLLTNVVARIC